MRPLLGSLADRSSIRSMLAGGTFGLGLFGLVYLIPSLVILFIGRVFHGIAWAAFNTGAASSVVLVTICYPWDFGGKLPLFKMANLSSGALLMQASAAFRTEPYN